jgi:hypothetical protein
MIDIETPLASESVPRELGPNQKMDIPTPPDSGWKTNGGYFSKNLVLSYDTISSGITNHFRKDFRFWQSSRLLKSGALFHPDSSQSK